MHPSEAIRGRHSKLLAGRRIVLGITGSIAAIEVPRVVRELIRHGADVRAVMSPEASRLVTEESVAFATGHRPVVQLTGDVEHVNLLGPGEGQADLLLIAPATANTIAKIAHGIDDTAVTSCASVALGGGVPILIAPAMHAHMGLNPAIRENIARLESWGVGLIAPLKAEGEEKLATPEEVAAAVLHRLGRGPWAGRRVVVVGGASHEPIDEVRSITNESSGETAVALATQAHYRGATVSLWAGPLQVVVPSFIPLERWGSVRSLLELARRERALLASADAVLVPAALSDFTLAPHPGKISSRESASLRLELTRAPKVLHELRALSPPPALLVGFKLEAGKGPAALAQSARRLLEEARLDVVVANDRASLGRPTTRVLVVRRRGRPIALGGPKMDVAGALLDEIGRWLPPHRPVAAASPPADHPVESARPVRGTAPRRG
jgi:phosphopantothenoylcysteine decarboxylase/phosphopantothenate--cysteine ligase